MPLMSMRRHFSLFVASPGDVQSERQRLEKIVSRLNRELSTALRCSIQLLRWEVDAVPGMGRPENLILPLVERCDIFVGLLWSRFGTPPGESPYGTFESGTEEEFYTALRRWRANGGLETSPPRILMYFSARRLNASTDPDQLRKVQDFKRRFAPGGEHPALTFDYRNLEEFGERLHSHLLQVLFSLSGGTGRADVIDDFVRIEPEEWQEWLGTSRQISLLMMYSRTWRNTYLNDIKRFVDRGGTLDVVLPSVRNDNASLELMAQRMDHHDPEKLKDAIRETALELASLTTSKAQVRVRYTRLYYTHALYLSENGGFVALYSYTPGRAPTPAVRLSPGPILSRYRDEFAAVFNGSTKD